jgi:hypothetical protein
MKPTVSMKMARMPEDKYPTRAVVSSVAKSLSSDLSSKDVAERDVNREWSSVLPALVYLKAKDAIGLVQNYYKLVIENEKKING